MCGYPTYERVSGEMGEFQSRSDSGALGIVPIRGTASLKTSHGYRLCLFELFAFRQSVFGYAARGSYACWVERVARLQGYSARRLHFAESLRWFGPIRLLYTHYLQSLRFIEMGCSGVRSRVSPQNSDWKAQNYS